MPWAPSIAVRPRRYPPRVDWIFDEPYFCCALCQDDDTPAPRKRRTDKELCVRCDRAVQQAQRYSLSIAHVNRILRFQRDVCALCGDEPSWFGENDEVGRTFWNIDHDHACCDRAGSCGQCVRGLLCQPCNASRLPVYERLPDVLRDSPRFNAYLTDPPAQHPRAQPIGRDFGEPRGL